MQLFIIIMQNIQTNCSLMICRLLVKKVSHLEDRLQFHNFIEFIHKCVCVCVCVYVCVLLYVCLLDRSQ
jgi:hypothetical protein